MDGLTRTKIRLCSLDETEAKCPYTGRAAYGEYEHGAYSRIKTCSNREYDCCSYGVTGSIEFLEREWLLEH